MINSIFPPGVLIAPRKVIDFPPWDCYLTSSGAVCDDVVLPTEYRPDDGLRQALLPARVHGGRQTAASWRGETTTGRQPENNWMPSKYLERVPESILNCFIQYDAFSISEIGNEFLKRQLLVLVKQKYVKNSWQKLSRLKSSSQE